MRTRNLTQKELASLTGLSQSAVSKYLRGNALPKSLELYRMARALGVTMEWLLGADAPAAPPADDYWKNEAIRLKANLDLAAAALEGALKVIKKS